jgi:rRNA maturation RNase YbeY
MFALRDTTRSRTPRIPFERIKQFVLGNRYELSLVLCGDALARRMNKEYRRKTYRPNVLSFPISKTEGEIFLNIRKAEREAKQLRIPLSDRLAYLYIHGCYHLKGHDHGDAMDRAEAACMKHFGFKPAA